MREVNTHKIIRIFLASSIDDTKEERDKLQNKILAVWNPIFNKFNMQQLPAPRHSAVILASGWKVRVMSSSSRQLKHSTAAALQ